MKTQPAFFEEHQIRGVYDESTETWWFSVVDIVQTPSPSRGGLGWGMG
jgi:DNA-damage-inducible protein D